MKTLSVFVFLLVFLPLSNMAKETYWQINTEEATQLNHFFEQCNGTNWENNYGWPLPIGQQNTTPTPYGISFISKPIQETDSFVIYELSVDSIILVFNNIEGTIPNIFLSDLKKMNFRNNHLKGNIPNLNLPNLEFLDLSYNEFADSLPNFILPKLEHLNLSNNQFCYKIPNFNLPNLIELNLSNNQFKDGIPLLMLPKLQKLNLSYNQLSDTIPSFDLPQLSTLVLNNNKLSGAIPDFKAQSLYHIDCSNNELYGEIPNFKHTNLQFINFSFNKLVGNIPNFELQQLKGIILNNNRLNGNIPNFNLQQLSYLFLSNNQLSGSIPNFNLPRLTRLHLNNNQLTGYNPGFNLPELSNLSLDYNKLTFTELEAFLKCPRLHEQFSVYTCLHQDTILPMVFDSINRTLIITSGGEYTRFTWYKDTSIVLFMGGNSITLPIEDNPSQYSCIIISTGISNELKYYTKEQPQSDTLKSITWVINQDELSQLNKFFRQCNGPDWIVNAGWPLKKGEQNTKPTPHGISFISKLLKETDSTRTYELSVKDIALHSNNLKGKLPNFAFTNLNSLYLPLNQLTGTIPDFNLPNLVVLQLNGNLLSGNIPNFNLPNLAVLELYGNRLVGKIPNFNFPKLWNLLLGENQLSDTIPNFDLPNLQYLHLNNNLLVGNVPNFNLPNLQELNIGSNKLSGDLPNIRHDKLEVLDLSNNQFSGVIPNFNLPRLWYLLLNNNQLTGNIPNFSIQDLFMLNLSQNQLEGQIPVFSNSSIGILNLSDNYLTGMIPKFHSLEITKLYLQNNLLNSISEYFDLRWLSSVNLSNNQLTFKEIENLSESSQLSYYNAFYYSPQDTIIPLSFNSQTRTLSVNTTGEYNNYKWLKGTSVIDSSSKKYIILPEGDKPEWYACEITNSNYDRLTLYTRPADYTAGVENDDYKKEILLTISPNPCSKYIKLNLDRSCKRNITISLFDIRGHLVYKLEDQPSDLEIIIPVENYLNGIYSLIVDDGIQRLNRKIVIAK